MKLEFVVAGVKTKLDLEDSVIGVVKLSDPPSVLATGDQFSSPSLQLSPNGFELTVSFAIRLAFCDVLKGDGV